MTSSERRESRRATPHKDVWVARSSDGERIGRLANLSLNGLLLLSSHPLPQTCTTVITLSSHVVEHPVLPLSLELECLWSEATGSNAHWSGAHFINLTPPQIVSIAQLIGDFESGRF